MLTSWPKRQHLIETSASPQMVRTSRSRSGVQAVGDGIQIVVEQARVDVQGHRRGGVAEHALDRLAVRPGLDREARCGVPPGTRL
jgi:hypothetical protein